MAQQANRLKWLQYLQQSDDQLIVRPANYFSVSCTASPTKHLFELVDMQVAGVGENSPHSRYATLSSKSRQQYPAFKSYFAEEIIVATLPCKPFCVLQTGFCISCAPVNCWH